MATAKQIAARKRFAEMARSGKLATLRKKAAPAKRAKNPIVPFARSTRGANYRGKYPHRIYAVSVSRDKSTVIVYTNDGQQYQFDGRDIGGEIPRVGDNIEMWLHAEEGKHAPRRPLSVNSKGEVRQNPLSLSQKVNRNTKRAYTYAVYTAKGNWVGSFPTLALAKTTAQEFADKTGRQYKVAKE